MKRCNRIGGSRLGSAFALTAITILGTLTLAPAALASPAAASPAATPAGGVPAQVAQSPVRPLAGANCVAIGIWQTCRTTNVGAGSSCRCIYALVTSNGWGNVYDAMNNKHVGPGNFFNGTKISGLVSPNGYYLVVRNILGPAAVGTISSSPL